MKILRTASLAVLLTVGMAVSAYATPSTQIWIPSTDVQGYGVLHPGIDTYIKAGKTSAGTRETTLTNTGLTLGVLPFDKIQAEVGVDHRYMGVAAADDSPFYLNAKLGVPEDKLASFFPALAVGFYDLGFEKNVTNNNIIYGLVAKTIPILGRVSVGYFTGNKDVLLDKTGASSNSGLMLSIDRTLTELTDKLWVAVDYQGSSSLYGALSFGVAYKFAPNVGVILGYDIYTYDADNVKPTVTLQLDIDADIFAPKAAPAPATPPAPAQAPTAPAK